jgi:hypothetical protein
MRPVLRCANQTAVCGNSMRATIAFAARSWLSAHAACCTGSMSVESSLSAFELFTRLDTAQRCR